MKKIAIKLINLYQNAKKDGQPRCRYVPSCSNYAKEAYEKYNFLYASFLILFRILRCNSLFKGGYDPVPKTLKEKRLLKESLKKVFEESFDPTCYIINHFF